MAGDFYVYEYRDPRFEPPVPIYVGKGTGKRDRVHRAGAKNPILRAKIRKIKEQGLDPIVVRVAEGLTEEAAHSLERSLVASYGRLKLGTGPLCNLTEGGEGTAGFRHSPVTKRKYSAKRRGKKQTPAQYAANCNRAPDSAETRLKKSHANKGHRRHTPQQLEAIREHNRTRIISEETRLLWSQQRKGRKQTPEHIERVKAAKKATEDARRAAMSPEEWEALQNSRYAKRRGQQRSEETKRKMREAWVQRKANRGPASSGAGND